MCLYDFMGNCYAIERMNLSQMFCQYRPDNTANIVPKKIKRLFHVEHALIHNVYILNIETKLKHRSFEIILAIFHSKCYYLYAYLQQELQVLRNRDPFSLLQSCSQYLERRCQDFSEFEEEGCRNIARFCHTSPEVLLGSVCPA